jgi:hypothetical protein
MNIYNKLIDVIGQYMKWKDIRHLRTFCWIVIGLLESGNVNLPNWTVYIESRAEKAQSIVRRFSRWLNNGRINIKEIYHPLIKYILKEWCGKVIYLMLDTTMLWDKYCIMRVNLNYRGRGIPLVWDIKEQGGSVIQLKYYRPLLMELKTLLPENCKVKLLADRGFADTELMKVLSKELKWNWAIRVKEHYYFYKKGKRIKIGSIKPLRGMAYFYNNIYLTAKSYGPVHLACGCPINGSDYWYVVSDERVSIDTFNDYALRFDIEESFRDEKTGGFNIEKSRLRSVDSLKRLYLVLSVATICLVSQGLETVKNGKRTFVDPHYHRGSSYFKIGWLWIKKAIKKHYDIINSLFLSSDIDTEPVISSKKQYKKKGEIKFLVYDYISV